MHLTLVAGTNNVVRFPVGGRAHPALMHPRKIGLGVSEVLKIADIGLPKKEAPQASEETTENDTRKHVCPELGAEPQATLDQLLAQLVDRAIASCCVAHDEFIASISREERELAFHINGACGVPSFEERVNTLTIKAARLMIDARPRSGEADGASRAVEMAVQCEVWIPFELIRETDNLFISAEDLLEKPDALASLVVVSIPLSNGLPTSPTAV